MLTLDRDRNAAAPVYILRVEENGSLSLQDSAK
jgi:hypothetical protein